VPQAHLRGRRSYAAGGKVLGDGSSINYGTWTRGSAVDYDRWAELVGDRRWSYAEMLPYFRRSEHHEIPGGDVEQHGFDGPIHTMSVSSSSNGARQYPLRENVRTAWAQLGVRFVDDANNGHPQGLVEVIENGTRARGKQPTSLTTPPVSVC